MYTGNEEKKTASNFIKNIIDEDLSQGKNDGRVHTRFPPEPNGYIHIGHTKAICINFDIGSHYNGLTNLRLDDTNPEKEDIEFIEAIKEDIKWLGFDWGDRLFYASDYYEKFYEYAVKLINKGLAYVCSLTADQVREYRGTLQKSGVNSPDRDRSQHESIDLFKRMRSGEFADGTYTLRAKIDMSSPNMNMRDPTIYRIRKVTHPKTGDKWCIYPMYDYAHCISDALEGITHSLCSLEFEDHRPLYNWFLEKVETTHRPQQIEFSRLNIDYTVMSKRLLNELVTENYVSGWSDPRMPTISGMRRRGYPAAAIVDFCRRVGVTKKDNCIELSYLETCVRDQLNCTAKRVMGVIDPLKVVIENYPEGKTEMMPASYHPKDESFGKREVPFSRELYIEKSDYKENANRKFFRLTEGREVRLRYGYFIKCIKAIKNDAGEVVELRCTYDPETRGGKTPPDGRKVKGTIHWVSINEAIEAEVRLYDRLFTKENPTADKSVDFKECINSSSLIKKRAFIEPSLKEAQVAESFQFERLGYFTKDSVDSTELNIVFNRVVTLRDSWAKIEKKS